MKPWGWLLLLPALARAERMAGLELAQVGVNVEARVRVTGLPKCPSSGSVYIEWTSPDPTFLSTVYIARWKSCAGGKAFTWGYRIVKRNGVWAKGPWTVRVLSGGRVLAQGSHTVR